MAGDWIKIRVTLDSDPAVVRISSGCKADRYAVVGRLCKLWSWANMHLTDGKCVEVDEAFLDSMVELPGFCSEMRKVGWLTGDDGCLNFPHFERHNGESAKKRALDADRKRRSRTSAKCPDEKRTKSGPEKRREEKSRVTKESTNKENANVERTKQARSKDDADFEAWYAAYPRRVGRAAAAKAFAKATKAIRARNGPESGDPAAFLVKRAEAFAKAVPPKGDPSARYTPYPATWLNSGRYDDDPASWQRSGPGSRIGALR